MQTYAVFLVCLIITEESSSSLKRKAQSYRRESIAESTKRSRRIQWDCYVRACNKFGWDPLPCTVDQACMYVSFLADKMKVSSIVTYYQAVIFMHTCYGLTPVTMSNPILKATVKGIENVEGSGEVGKDPLFPKDLLCISKIVNMESHLEIVVFAAMLFLFRTLLRVSHVVDSKHTALHSDVKFNSQGFLLSVKTAKNLKSKEKNWYVPVVRSKDSSICAVSWLERVLAKSQVKVDSPLFATESDTSLSYSLFSRKFKTLIVRAGLNGNFASHSLRRGGATHMSMKGCSVPELKDRGGWKSDCVFKYICQPISYKVEVDRKVLL